MKKCMVWQTKNVNRRRFLKRAARIAVGAVGFPYVVSSSALGLAGSVAPSERIIMGAIGLGGQGVRDMQNIMTQDDVRFVAVCDVDPQRLREAKKIVDTKYGHQSCAAYSNFREVLARDDIDAVLMATGERWHALLSIYATEAGKDIYCEKPMSLTIAEGRALADTVKRYQTVYQCGTQRRSMRNFAFAVQTARSGMLGQLRILHSFVGAGWICQMPTPEPIPRGFDYDMWLGPAPYAPYSAEFVHSTWRSHYDYCGGMITDWGAHCNDLAQMANGTDLTGPVEYEGTAGFPTEGFCNVPVQLHVTATYADGVKLVMYDKRTPDIWPVMNGELAVMFEGEEGYIYVDDGGNLAAKPESILKGRKSTRQSWTDASNWAGHHRNFLDCVKTRAVPIASAEVAHRSTTTCHIANICLRLGRKLRWNPQTETFVNDAEADRMISRAKRSPWRL